MSELHPEAIIERVAQDRAGPEDRRRLAAHLLQCDVCRLELAVRRASEATLAHAHDDDARLRAAIDAVIVRAAERPVVGRRSRTLEAMLVSVAIAVAILLLGSLAHRVLRGGVLRDGDSAALEQASLQAPEEARPRTVAGPEGALRKEAGTRADPALPHESPAHDPDASVQAAAEAGEILPDRDHTVARDRSAVRPSLPRTSASLFAEATQARRSGRIDRALTLFERVIEDHPRTREAATSRVLAGRMWLESKREPRRALALFESYLRESDGGSLRPEALAGKARCLERLGEPRAARAAWTTLIDRYPESAPATSARAHLSEGDSP